MNEEKGKFFLKIESQPTNTERMTELESHHLAMTVIIINSSKKCQ
jgi:hypothetical protein